MNETVTNQTVDVLNRLIEVCKDSENGFRTASEESTDSEFSALCLQYSQQRGRFASELQEEVSRLGEKPKSDGTVTGSLKRGWMNVKAAVSREPENSAIEQCEQGEDDIKAAYETALKAYLPTTITAILQRQYEKVCEGHDRFSAMQKAIR